ncbi:hypothetical protein KC19_7G070000 [Ceratodon purpureus]|uniref:non-specific serine/threonine protein kinase n=1 Tax=Ceratodon purpureus TaxID=3225 RepID=A0A8T0H752_CERPU|nr:hypothetical protein KC19_7G070000 [Ceratodon purpureus]
MNCCAPAKRRSNFRTEAAKSCKVDGRSIIAFFVVKAFQQNQYLAERAVPNFLKDCKAMKEESTMPCICKPGFAGVALMLLAVMIRFSYSNAVTNPADTVALQAFRRALQDPVDLHLENWKGSNPCEMGWYGVFCTPPAGPNNITYVMELRLFQLNLSGILAPELGDLSMLMSLNLMWNKFTGGIPSSFQRLSSLQLLLLNGNQLTGSLPPELGYLPQLNRIQIDQNRISGSIPSTFGGLRSVTHLHMNDNLLNGTIPRELGALPNLVHLLLDNNAFSGALPPEIANAPKLQIIQLDNNLFGTNATIPPAWGNIRTLLKLMRNCGISGIIPDLSGLTSLSVLDLSNNNLTGNIPFFSVLPPNMRTLDLSNNSLTGQIPNSVGSLQFLEVLMLRNNRLIGTIPQTLGTAPTFQSKNYSSVIDLQNNNLANLVNQTLATLAATSQTQVRLAGNPSICPTQSNSTTINPLCIFNLNPVVQFDIASSPVNPSDACQNCEPITVGYRLKSPGFTVFDRHDLAFTTYLSSGLNLSHHQVVLRDYTWQRGPRLAMTIQLLPERTTKFNDSEFDRLYRAFSDWLIPDGETFGPYELITFDPRATPTGGKMSGSKKGLSAVAVAGIVLGVTIFAVFVTSVVLVLKGRRHRTPIALRSQMSQLVRMARAKKNPALKVAGVRFFTFKELAKATNQFDVINEIGQGGYGKVYKATLEEENKVVAVKRAQRESLQGLNEFYTEIEFLSRVHHRNLLGLVGYCDDEGEQMLVYDYMPGGNLRHQLESHKNGGVPLDFPTRLRIAIGSARGLLYLHTEADPPIIHRDIKAANILLDNFKVAKVADFGLSKQAPVPDMYGNTPSFVSTGVKGTPGYIDPEYYLTRQLTEKSDVFSFGVVLLELITGTRAISKGKNIVREVQLRNEAGEILSLVDPDVVHYPWGPLERFMRVGLKCCEDMPEKRPDMAEVVRDLESIASSSSDTGSCSPDSYALDMPHASEGQSRYHWDDSQNSDVELSAPSVKDVSDSHDTVELLSKTVSFVRVR